MLELTCWRSTMLIRPVKLNTFQMCWFRMTWYNMPQNMLWEIQTAITRKKKCNWRMWLFILTVVWRHSHGSITYENAPPWTCNSSRISLLICAGVMYSFPSNVCTTSSFFSWISLETISMQFLSDSLWNNWHKSYKRCILPGIIYFILFLSSVH